MQLPHLPINMLQIIQRNKLLLVVAVVTCIWVWSDVTNRLNSKNNYDVNEQKQVQITALNSPIITAQNVERIQQLYEKYRKQADGLVTESAIGMSLQEQESQSGTLTNVYSGDKVLSLKAVIMDKADKSKSAKHYVLVSVSDVKTRESTTVSVANKNELLGFQFHIVNNVSVKLTRVTQENNSVLSDESSKLILVMYLS